MNLIEDEVFKINLSEEEVFLVYFFRNTDERGKSGIIGHALFNFLCAQKMYKKKTKCPYMLYRLTSKKRHTKRITASSCVKLQNGSVQESIKHYNYSTLKNPLKEGVLM
jgi:hypothetical protein